MAKEKMTKRITISDTRWKDLGQLKRAGQTYDELLGEMLQAHHRRQLAIKATSARKGQGTWHILEDT